MKALFTDFYGTLVREDSPVSVGVATRIYKSSNAKSFDEVVVYWWKEYRKRIAQACGQHWQLQQDLALGTLENVLAHFESDENAIELRDAMNVHWSNPLIFDDAKRFLDGVLCLNIPVYFVTNSDDIYITESMKLHGLTCVDIITSERARYSKPRPEIFQFALDTLGLMAKDVVHIGDSLESDVTCPSSLGIQAILLNREGAAVPSDVLSVANLDEALQVIRTLCMPPVG